MSPNTQIEAKALAKFHLWFFRDMSDEQRLALFSIFGMPVDEIGKVHGHQRRALKHILNAIALREAAVPSEEPVAAFAARLSAWKDEHHDCDCAAHESCGCKELREIIQEMDCASLPEGIDANGREAALHGGAENRPTPAGSSVEGARDGEGTAAGSRAASGDAGHEHDSATDGWVATVVWHDPRLDLTPPKPSKIIDASLAFMDAAPLGTKLFASPAVAPVVVSVKGLEWEEIHQARSNEDPNTEVVGWEAEVHGFGLSYIVELTGGGASMRDPDYDEKNFDDPEAAKAAAQADFNARILSSIIPATKGGEIDRKALDAAQRAGDEAYMTSEENAVNDAITAGIRAYIAALAQDTDATPPSDTEEPRS